MIYIKIGIMQPYFFPYLGYYALIKYTDYFIIFDTPQYIRKGWVNRNQILDANGKACYITVPTMTASRETTIRDTKISTTNNWLTKILGQLTVYKKRAPYYNQVLELLEDLGSKQFEYLSELNIYSLEKTCDYLGLPYHYDVFSKMNLKIDEVHAPDEWALNISKALHYDTYVNPIGGLSFFNDEKYQRENINLEFLKMNFKPYPQRNGAFLEGLSILDVMMFLEPNEILALLDHFTIVKASNETLHEKSL